MAYSTLTRHEAENQIDELLSCPQQIWLLGAGISCEAGVPLMHPLTKRVEACLSAEESSDARALKIFKALKEELPKDHHVEDILSHLGDLMSLSSRSGKAVHIGEDTAKRDELAALHLAIQKAICDIVRWGYKPADEQDGKETKAEEIGDRDHPIVRIDDHLAFVEALYSRREGRESLPPVEFFTTNYDTLLEDALALCRIYCNDGFQGGSMAFWDSESSKDISGVQASLYKLHGSIDWFSRGDIVVRRRDGVKYPVDAAENLLIYPQATKYKVTQKDPFASLFTRFRSALTGSQERVLLVCGYSFGDEHINEEIRRALEPRDSSLTMVAFARESDDMLPKALREWLGSNDAWCQRLLVATDNGFYHKEGAMNRLTNDPERNLNWWTFRGLTQFLRQGPGHKYA